MRTPGRDPVGPGQESVWDYPRPPSAEVTPRRVAVEVGGRVVKVEGLALRDVGGPVLHLLAVVDADDPELPSPQVELVVTLG